MSRTISLSSAKVEKRIALDKNRILKKFAEDLHERDVQWEQMFEQVRKDGHDRELHREKEFNQ